MRIFYFLIIVNLLFFTSCTKHIITLDRNEIPLKSVVSPEEFNEFSADFSDNYILEDRENSIEVKKNQRRKTIEEIPNFQSNEFKLIKTKNRAKIKKDLVISGGDVKVNVESIPLNEFIDFIFSSVLKMTYTVDKNVKKMTQPITLNMAKPQAKKKVLAVVENILKHESVILNQKDGTLFISKASNGKVSNKGLSDRYMVLGRELPYNIKDMQKVLMFVPFYYTKPQNIFNFARKLKVTNVKINYLNKNIAILSGEAFDVKQVLELINIIDAPSMEQKIPYTLELEYIDVKKFTEQIKSIFESNSIPIANNIREVGIVLNPIKEINTLLVLSSKKSWIDMLSFWKNKLDVLSEIDNEHSELFIYKVKHRKADELANVLQDVLSVTSNSTNNQILNHNYKSIDNNKTIIHNNKNMKIKSDLHTNSIMMNITPVEYKKILPIIKKLDTQPLQVAVEVILAEVDMTNTFNLGFEWSLLNNQALRGKPTKVSGAYTLGLGGGSGVTSNLFTKNLTSVINAFAEKKQLEILSRPRLLILNNKTGNINVGQQVPVVSSEASATDLQTNGTNPSILRNISYITTGMTLNLTPTINSNGTLTLDIGITLSEAQTNKTSKIDSPLIVNRSLTTSAVMQSGNSILLGGIISHNNSNGHGGVPLLQDLPFIGDMFKSQSKSNVKTELIILIKPVILKNSRELYRETELYKIMLKSIKRIFL
jgi:general secretion pathway protein D